jgi:hypothetical protein
MNFLRHAKEFATAFRRHQYEITDDGAFFFPAQRVFASGVYHHRIRGKTDWEASRNLLPTEGLNFLLDSFVASHAAIPLYMSLYAGAISPAANWTALSYPATASEIVSSAEGYTESVRQTWVAVAAVTATKDNYASPAAFTIATASALNVNGASLHTVSTKGGTTGALVSSTRFNAVRTFANTDVFDVKYQLALTSS